MNFVCMDPLFYYHSEKQSMYRFLGRSLLSTAHLTKSFSFIHFSCPLVVSLLSHIFSLSSTTFNSFLMSLFLILSRLLTPLIARRHLISTTSSFSICFTIRSLLLTTVPADLSSNNDNDFFVVFYSFLID